MKPMKPETNTEIAYRVFDVIYKHTGAGPFDGGCVVYAEALKAVFGGVIVSLIKSNDTADHAAVLINDTVYDYEGGLPKTNLLTALIDTKWLKLLAFGRLGSLIYVKHPVMTRLLMSWWLYLDNGMEA